MLEFIILAFLSQIAAAACLVHFYRFPDRLFRDVTPYLRPSRQSELEDLLDALREENLASALGHKRFRKEQLKRIHLTQECIARRTHNARIFQEWAQTEFKRSAMVSNGETGENAHQLIDACLSYRIHGLLISIELYGWYVLIVLLPFMRPPLISSLCQSRCFDLIHSYAAVERTAEMLASGCGDECRHMLIRTLRTMSKGRLMRRGCQQQGEGFELSSERRL